MQWRHRLPDSVRPYVEAAPIAAFFLGISSGFGFAMIAATLTTRLAQDGIKKSAVTAFAFTFLAFNFKWLWAPLVDTVRIPGLGRFGQRRAWLWLHATAPAASRAQRAPRSSDGSRTSATPSSISHHRADHNAARKKGSMVI